MTRATWIVACLLSAAVIGGFVGLSYWEQTRNLGEVRAELAAVRNEAVRLTNDLSVSQARIEELEREKEAVTLTQKGLEQQMRQALQSKEVTISDLKGKLTVNILDRILFDSGEAELKPEGKEILRQIAEVLKQHPHLQIHVVGHTDNVPIYISYPSNWELSAARATAAVRFLSEKAGVDPRRLGTVGYGEFRPVADNSTPEGRARNRRIAIVVVSEELVGSDVAPTAKVLPAKPPTTAPAPTNTPSASSLAVTNQIPDTVTHPVITLKEPVKESTPATNAAPIAHPTNAAIESVLEPTNKPPEL